MKSIIALLLLIGLSSALHASFSHVAASATDDFLKEYQNGLINLQADSGKYLARCEKCGTPNPSYPYDNSAGVHGENPIDPIAIWSAVKIGDKIALKGDNGLFLSRCYYCWQSGSYPNSVFVHVPEEEMRRSAYAQWTPELLSDGKWAFKSDVGTYLARCNGCVTGGKYPDMAFLVFSDTKLATSHWKVTPYVSPADKFLEEYPDGVVNLQADSGKYLARCEKCGTPNPSYPYDNSAGVHGENPIDPIAIWSAVKIGDKIALKGDNGLFLSRCYYCWQSGSYPNSVFVHVPEEEMRRSAYAQWTPELLSDGKWAFKSDVGTYLARCNGCVTGGKYPDMAFLVFSDTKLPTSHWKVSPINSFPIGVQINLQGENGKYLARCYGCGVQGKYINSATVHEKNPKSAWATWVAEKIGDQVALKSDYGTYLALCPKCWPTATYSDAAFVHVTDPKTDSNALWTP